VRARFETKERARREGADHDVLFAMSRPTRHERMRQVRNFGMRPLEKWASASDQLLRRTTMIGPELAFSDVGAAEV